MSHPTGSGKARDGGVLRASDAALAWLVQALELPDKQLTLARMQGSTSSSIYLIQHLGGAEPRRAVLRVLDNARWLADEPDLAAHEAAALEEAQRAGLRAPRLLAYSATDVGFGGPVVLMTLLEGAVELRPASPLHWLNELAVTLGAVHSHPADGFSWLFSSWVDRAALQPPEWARDRRLWERAIELWSGPAPECPQLFIHRDYHPTNVLWRGRGMSMAVSGVVDWINACRGPAGVDVAHCRTNLAQMFGPDVAGQFLSLYMAAVPDFVYQPYWDVDSILDMCLPSPSFYEPWTAFGLDAIAQAELNRRIEAYLARVMRQV